MSMEEFIAAAENMMSIMKRLSKPNRKKASKHLHDILYNYMKKKIVKDQIALVGSKKLYKRINDNFQNFLITSER